MIGIFNVRGYRKLDPLDYVSDTLQTVIPMVVTCILTIAMVVLIDPVFHLVKFCSVWMMVAEVIGFTLFAAVIASIRKSSSLIIYLVVLLPLWLLDLYLESHVRGPGVNALWSYYPGTFITDVSFAPLRFLMTISVDALLIGPIALFLSRLIALAFHDKTQARLDRSRVEIQESVRSPFDRAWSDEVVPKPPRKAEFWILRVLGIIYLAYLLLLVVGAFGSAVWPEQVRSLFDMTYANPYFGVSTYSKISFMVVLAFTAAYNRKIRWHATMVLCFGHLMSVASSLAFYFVGGQPADQHQFLLVSAIVDMVMVLLFAWIIIRSAKDRYDTEEDQTFPSTFSLPARLSRTAFIALGIVAILFMAGIVLVRFLMDKNETLAVLWGSPDPTLCNTLTMYFVIAMVSLMIAVREHLRVFLTQVLLLGFILTMLTGVVWLLVAPVVVLRPGAEPVAVGQLFTAHVLIVATLYGAIVALRKMFYDVDYTITAFNPSSARNVIALHDALVDPSDHGAEAAKGPELTRKRRERSSDVLQSIDRYASAIRGRKRGLLNFPFWLIENVFNIAFALRPTYAAMSPDEQRYFLRHYLLRRPEECRRACMPAFADFARGLTVAAHAIVTFATYSQIRRHAYMNYVPPGARDRLQEDTTNVAPPFNNIATLPTDKDSTANYRPKSSIERKEPAPRISTPVHEPSAPDEVDFVVVGSGPGAAVMAYRIAESCEGATVLIVERGGRYSPLQDFNDREIEMMPKLYKEGGLQQTKRGGMFVLQGECVGGGSVINNAVCYKMRPNVKQQWINDYGIDLTSLDKEYEQIGEELGIVELPPAGINQRSAARFQKGVTGYNSAMPEQLDIIDRAPVNGAYMIGDGLWNIGNKYLRKRSVLETYIPWAEARGMTPKGNSPYDSRVMVLSNTTAVQFLHEKGTARSVVLRRSTGGLQTVKVRKAIAVAGGVIASSHFLMRSGVEGHVGERMSCNFAFPLAFEVDEVIKGYDGEQITMGATAKGHDMIFETYFNPPSAFAISVPFYLSRLESLMGSYERLISMGVLVNSEPNGTIERKPDLLNGQAFTWSLGPTDQTNIKFALETLLRIGMHAGATRAVLPMQPGVDLDLSKSNREDVVGEFVKRLGSYHLSMTDMLMSTAHPQGGNLMAHKDSKMGELAVVDHTFRVKGFDNVFVADASLFPTGVAINPQWTIMAMSSLASRELVKLWKS